MRLTIVDAGWMSGNKVISAFFDALSVHIPESERFIIRAVQEAEPLVRDGALRTRIMELLGEEDEHSRAHDAYNRALMARGYRFSRFESLERSMNAFVSRRVGLRTRLAICLSIEHFTALMSKAVIDRRLLESDAIVPSSGNLWRWHAVEEFGHRSVAFHIYRALDGGYAQRAFVMMVVTALFLSIHIACLLSFFRQSDAFSQKDKAKEGRSFLFGKGGMYRTIARGWFLFFRPGFDPDADLKLLHDPQFGDRAALERMVFAELGVA